eukprot:Polyplicarium_translucidae@DN3041_c0_g1_i1.p2
MIGGGEGQQPPGLGGKYDDVRENLDTAVSTMRQNVQLMSERGEAVGSILNKSEGLQSTAEAFTDRSRELESDAFWKRWRLVAIAAFVVAAVLAGTWFISRPVFWGCMAGGLCGAGAAFVYAWRTGRTPQEMMVPMAISSV